MNTEKPRLLLHSCCGPCSTAVIERLAGDYDVTLYYYNPNITDPAEYEKRRSTQVRFLELYNTGEGRERPIPFIEGAYDRENFYEIIKGLEGEPEGGKRCDKCFELRLAVTAGAAKEMGFDFFGTTLSVSPHKDYIQIANTGNRLADRESIAFIDMDFKKKAGYQRSVQISKEYQLYRQNYCGCEFSKKYAR